jgi:hypothetical protein
MRRKDEVPKTKNPRNKRGPSTNKWKDKKAVKQNKTRGKTVLRLLLMNRSTKQTAMTIIGS